VTPHRFPSIQFRTDDGVSSILIRSRAFVRRTKQYAQKCVHPEYESIRIGISQIAIWLPQFGI
jgi:hypothetical protein